MQPWAARIFYFLFTIILIYTIFTLWFAVSAYREMEPRAGMRGVMASAGMLAFLVFYALAQANGLLDGWQMQIFQGIIAALLYIFTILMFVPIGRRPSALKGTAGMQVESSERFNQKDTAFNIAHVGGYGPDVGKKRWALQSRDPFGGIYWTLVMGLRQHAEGKVNSRNRSELTPEAMTKEVKRIARYCGANGAGKTTLLKTICGLIAANAGSIEYEGIPIQRKSPSTRVKKGLVLVPEGRNILRRMTVYENLLMGAYCRTDRAEIKLDIEKVFERFPNLAKRKHLSADVLSGGEQQMLAIGRAMLARPKILMMDEPSLGLSPILITEIFAIISDLHRSGMTILLVEQNALKALRVADRGYVMETGEIVMADTCECLLGDEKLCDAYLGGKV